ncbi:MAG TPA: hypothetical protein VE825_06360 [Terriglobales bacterium]|jgi:hypothetical protein|nr:hypothetical protein [Terriglobales bacterium]
MRLRLATLGLLLTLWVTPAFAQGCAMCYTSAEGASQRGQLALSHAVLALMIPTLGLIAGFAGITVYMKDSHQREDDEALPRDEEF